MSEIIAELERVDAARRAPTLRLLNHKWSPFVLAVFRAAFNRHTKVVPCERLHAQVDAHLAELVSLHHDAPPADGRSLCLAWLKEGWLSRVQVGDEGECYELTSNSLAARRVVDALVRDRALLSESRLATIVSTVRRTVLAANPDKSARIASLTADIAKLTAERDALVAGEEPEESSDEHMAQAYANVVDLLAQLPGDFRRVEEAVDHMRRRMMADFRSENRPRGDVLDEYLRASEHLTDRTEEGRAFEGALAMLSDETVLAEFREDLRTIMAHPFSQSVASSDRRDFMNAAGVLREGLYNVQAQQHKASATLAEHLSGFDAAGERELTTVLHSVQHELTVWRETASTRATVPMPWMPERATIEHLRTRVFDPRGEQSPPPLEDVHGSAPDAPTLDEVRRHGGPLTAEVRDAARAVLSRGGGATVAQAFEQLPDDLRRPVELYGLAHLATEAAHETSDSAVVVTKRPDGSTRTFTMPAWDASAVFPLDEEE